jgi:hypothetical protein
MNGWLAAPIILPFSSAAISLLGRRHPLFQSGLAIATAFLHLGLGVWLLYRTP